MQCCCDSGRCWSDGSSPEMCPMRGTGRVNQHQSARNVLLSSVFQCRTNPVTLASVNVLILEEYQRLCIQIPDGNGRVLIPGPLPGSPDIPGIYTPVIPPRDPFQVPLPGPNNQGPFPGQPQYPPQLPLQPPPGMLSSVCVSHVNTLKRRQVHSRTFWSDCANWATSYMIMMENYNWVMQCIWTACFIWLLQYRYLFDTLSPL